MLLAAVPEPGAAAETRVALVIGNGAYRNAPPLANPANDARAVAAALRRLDFTVEEGQDLDHAGIQAALSRFADALQDADVGLVFYAGHGLQVQGQNYLVPIDATLSRQADLILQAIDFTNVLRLLEDRPRTSLVFLDACRDNPLARSLARSLGQSRSQVIGQGLAEVESGIGTMIAYATQPGNVASDGQGDHSPFTAALLANLETPGLEVGQMLRRVRKTVIDRTAHQQVPWDHSSLTGDFYFKSPEPSVATPTPSTGRDKEVWQAITSSPNPEDFRTFIEQYPDSPFAAFARKRILTLRGPSIAGAGSEPVTPVPITEYLPPPSDVALAPTPPAEPPATLPEPAAPPAAEASEEPVETAALIEDAPASVPASKPATGDSPESAELALGWSQDDWREIQRGLNALGHPAGREDGRPGRQTRSAVAAWQQASNNEPSGYLTADQRTRLLKQAKPQIAAFVATKQPPTVSKAPTRDTPEVARARKAAEQGDAAAQVDLGLMYENGRDVAQDYVQAVAWYRKAADQGHARGQHNLGWMYQEGRGVAQNDVQAVAWYRKAAAQGDTWAQVNLGNMYSNARGVPQDDTQAVAWYRKAAEQDFDLGQNNLGEMYLDGRGVPQDDAQAVAWFRKAAEQGNAWGQHNLGRMYKEGRGIAQDYVQAVTWYRKAAEQGNAAAQTNLGAMYDEGRGVPQDDAQAAAWYRKAAEQGDAGGQNNLGWMYENGLGVPQDDVQAVAWFRKAAEQGNATTQINLGWMYANGRGVPQDDAQAAAWYRKAAEQGDARGQYQLGSMYEDARGVTLDYAQAVAWYRKAAEQGLTEAIAALKRLDQPVPTVRKTSG